jgi:hypothetical protein
MSYPISVLLNSLRFALLPTPRLSSTYPTVRV